MIVFGLALTAFVLVLAALMGIERSCGGGCEACERCPRRGRATVSERAR